MNIVHNVEESRFETQTAVDLAVLEYRRPKSSKSAAGSIDFTRTYVPANARGQGIAEALVRQGLKWARAEGFEITASCWYVEKFLKDGDSLPK